MEARDILIADVRVKTSEVPSCLQARVVGQILSKSLIKPRWSLEAAFWGSLLKKAHLFAAAGANSKSASSTT